MSKPSDAIKYAEETLRVHAVHTETVEARNRLDEIFTDLAVRRDVLRETESLLSDREMEIASDERGKHADMSATAMEKHLKIALSNDPDVRELRKKITHIKSDIEGIDFDRSVAEHDIRIGCARMIELGGYFEYLAVVKAVANKAVMSNAGTVTPAT